MASGWTESGIDWDNLSTQSPRDVIRELYIAVDERNYWIKHFSSGGALSLDSLDPIDYDCVLRHRTKEQISYICSSIEKWLRPISSIPIDDRDFLTNTYHGCMLDLNNQSSYQYQDYTYNGFAVFLPRFQEKRNLEWSTYNSEENGAYESLLNLSLGFMRSYSNSDSFRFTHEMMYTVFKILETMNFIRCYTLLDVNKCVPSFTNTSDSCVRVVDGYGIYMKFLDSNGYNGLRYDQPFLDFPENQPQQFSVKRDQVYNTARTRNQNVVESDFLLINGSYQGQLWQMESEAFYCRFDYQGYSGQTFSTKDFSFKNLNYSFSYALRNNTATPIGGDYFVQQSDYNIPKYSNGWSISDDNIESIETKNNDSLEINPSLDGDYLLIGKGRQVDGDIPNLEGQNTLIRNYYINHSLPLINFNKEGFLKYYTEDD